MLEIGVEELLDPKKLLVGRPPMRRVDACDT
jgi:hypothetical protein